MPELATTVISAIKKQAEVALGNVVGSIIFNLLGITGVATLFGNITVASSFFQWDFWVMLGSALLMIPLVFVERRCRVYLNYSFGVVFWLHDFIDSSAFWEPSIFTLPVPSLKQSHPYF